MNKSFVFALRLPILAVILCFVFCLVVRPQVGAPVITAGVTPTTIKVGHLTTENGPLTDMSLAAKAVLTAYFKELNEGGGVFSRRIELVPVPTGATPSATASNVKAAIDSGILAIVGGPTVGADEEIGNVTLESKTLLIGPLTLTPQTATPLNPYVFYTLSGVREQAVALLNLASRDPKFKSASAVVLFSKGPLTGKAADTLLELSESRGYKNVAGTNQMTGQAPSDWAAAFRESKTNVVFFFRPELDAFLQEAEKAGWYPDIYTLSPFVGRNTGAATAKGFKDKLHIAFPTSPADQTPAGTAEYQALAKKYDLPKQSVAAQISTLATAKLFVEGLRLAGKELTRQKLLTGLESLKNFETGLTPKLTYGPGRRVGAMGSYMISVDPETKQLVSAGGWVDAN